MNGHSMNTFYDCMQDRLDKGLDEEIETHNNYKLVKVLSGLHASKNPDTPTFILWNTTAVKHRCVTLGPEAFVRGRFATLKKGSAK